MISGNINNSPIRSVKGKVELFEGSTLLNTFSYDDKLSNFEVSREGEGSKFFGFGICQKLTLKLTDKDRELNITENNSFKVYLTTDDTYITPFPTFYVDNVKRDENTNELTITAYDALYWASKEKIKSSYTLAFYLWDFALCALPSKLSSIDDSLIPDEILNLEFSNGASLEGTESCKDVLDDIAEVYQAIYYVDNTNTLIFKRLDKDGSASLVISKADYFTLKNKANKTLAAICKATELGDNVSTPIGIDGTTQYIRDNAFLEKREDLQTLLDNAIAALGGLTINQFECSWRGNFLLEPGDKINLITKDDDTITTYVLSDKIIYDGGLKQDTKWQYEDNTGDNHYNPTTLGEALYQTYARVDKANKTITQVVSDVSTNSEKITTLQNTTTDITATVSSMEETTNDAVEQINGNLETLTKSVEAKLTDEEVTIKITEALSNGVDKVETSTGFTFDDTGLTVSKTDSEITTTITEDGMTVYKDSEAVLTANNIGVDARNLHATTYLIIGNNSRFEDYGSDRTGCFWIGG